MSKKEVDKKDGKTNPTHVVVKPFRDIDNFDKMYNIGEDVSHLSEERLKHLIEIGHVSEPE